jgi:hypothetical protein
MRWWRKWRKFNKLLTAIPDADFFCGLVIFLIVTPRGLFNAGSSESSEII